MKEKQPQPRWPVMGKNGEVIAANMQELDSAKANGLLFDSSVDEQKSGSGRARKIRQ